MRADVDARSGFQDLSTIDLALPRDAHAPRIARVALRELLDSHGWPPAEDAELILSELVSNAVQHGVGQIALSLWLASGRIHGEVSDAGTGASRRPELPGANAIGGRGLVIVDALSDRWGAAETTSRVWFEIAHKPPAAP